VTTKIRAKAEGPACERHRTPECVACHGRAHAEWAVLGDEELRLLNGVRATQSYGAGQVIFKQGSPCLGIYCVDAGEVALRKSDDHGASGIVRLAHAGQTIGYRAFFSGGPYTATAEALTDCRVCFIPADVVRTLLAREPQLATRFLKRATEDLRSSEEARLHATSLSTRARLAHFLLALKDTRGEVGDDNVITMELPLSRTDLAALLGARRESIARAIRGLQDDGVAEFDGRTVRVSDLDALLDELEDPARE
jgi:CRP-like cAMP-binding protein